MFITLEGIEGTGKSTQLKLMAEYLESRGQDVLLTREPGGSDLGRELRRMLLHMDSQGMAPTAELFLYLADRAQHVAQVIRPALEAGKWVISDRFADSTVVYQGYGRGLDPKLLHSLNAVAVDGLWPEMTILLDLDPETGLNRALARNLREGKSREEGRFEAEALDFHRRVREGYLTWAALHPDRFRLVDGKETPEVVFQRVRDLLEPHLP
ncbi:dTMP kinase [Desulfovibrio aminophilus]|nr:dTMP kinase [Desulfovibrio aminophilus]MCM0754490.1 dTMP kinase [Desulfovibrio aminophilus]